MCNNPKSNLTDTDIAAIGLSVGCQVESSVTPMRTMMIVLIAAFTILMLAMTITFGIIAGMVTNTDTGPLSNTCGIPNTYTTTGTMSTRGTCLGYLGKDGTSATPEHYVNCVVDKYLHD